MKAKELKQWVNQLKDDEDIYITAMDDQFFQDFECHSIYEDGQAQELVLPVYVEKYQQDGEEPYDKIIDVRTLVQNLPMEELEELIASYSMYIVAFPEEHDEGSYPVSLMEYYDNEFQEIWYQ